MPLFVSSCESWEVFLRTGALAYCWAISPYLSPDEIITQSCELLLLPL